MCVGYLLAPASYSSTTHQMETLFMYTMHTDYLKSEGRVVPLIIQVSYNSVSSQRNGACRPTVLHMLATIPTKPGELKGSLT